MTFIEIIFICIYYIVAICAFAMYIVLMHKSGLQVISFTGLAYLLSCFSIIIPAPYIGYGVFFKGTTFYEGFKWDLFLIYVVFAFFFPISLWLGRYFARSIYFRLRDLQSVNVRLALLTLAVSCYMAYFLAYIGLKNLPIVSLLMGNNFSEAVKLKMELQDIAQSHPFIGKWHTIVLPFYMILAFYYYLKCEDGKYRTKVFFFFLFFWIIFLTSIRLGRDDFVQFLFALLFVKTILYRKPFFAKLSVLLLVLVVFFYLFSFETSFDLFRLLNILVERFVNQSGYTYVQIDFIKNGFLWFEGVNMPFLGELLGLEFKSPSSMAFNALYGGTFSGGTAGLSYATMYFCFGILGLIISFFLSTGIAFIDGCYLNTIKNAKGNTKKIVSAFYFTFISLYCVNLLTNFYAFYSFPFVLNVSFSLLNLYLFVLTGPFKVHFSALR